MAERCGECGDKLQNHGRDWVDGKRQQWLKCENCKQTYLKELVPFYCYPVFLLLKLLAHNDDHTTRVNMCNMEFNVCTRCFGAYIACIVFIVVFAPLYFYGVSLPFLPVLLFCYMLAGVTIYDWVGIHVFDKKPNYKMIFCSGFLLGLSAMLYLWLLPTPSFLKLYEDVLYIDYDVSLKQAELFVNWGFKLGTLILYNLLAILLYMVGGRGKKT